MGNLVWPRPGADTSSPLRFSTQVGLHPWSAGCFERMMDVFAMNPVLHRVQCGLSISCPSLMFGGVVCLIVSEQSGQCMYRQVG